MNVFLQDGHLNFKDRILFKDKDALPPPSENNIISCLKYSPQEHMSVIVKSIINRSPVPI